MSKKNRRRRKKEPLHKPFPFVMEKKHYINEELETRKRYSEWMDIEDPTKVEYAYYTRNDLVEKYAKEYSFWCNESFIDDMPTHPEQFARTYMASIAKVKVLKHMGKKFKEDDEMLKNIYERCKILYTELSGKEDMKETDILMLSVCTSDNKKS